MAYYATRYEVAIEVEGVRALVTYTARKSRQGGLTAILRTPAILDRFEGQAVELADKAADGILIVDPDDGAVRARLFFTGRTERDAASMGALPRFGEAA